MDNTKGKSLLSKIQSLNEESTYEDIIEITEYDNKDSVVPSSAKKENSINNFMNYKKGKYGDCDRYEEVLQVYTKLNWCKEIKKTNRGHSGELDSKDKQISFDTINSFVQTYQCALAIYYSDDFEYEMSSDFDAISVICKNHPKIYHIPNNWLSKNYKKFTKVNELDYLNNFARLTHSIGNFMTCPKYPYNTSKAFCKKINDYMDLMIAVLQNDDLEINYNNYGTDYSISKNKKKEWKEWFKNNVDDLLLDDYIIKRNEKEPNNFTSKPFFKEHSPDHSLIESKEELEECVKEMNNRIRIRGLRIIINLTKVITMPNIKINNKKKTLPFIV